MKNEKNYFFDKKENIQKILYGFYALCAVLLAADFIIHRHTYHSWEQLPGFYPIFGFAACVALVLVATQMRKMLMKPENYYDRETNSAEKDS